MRPERAHLKHLPRNARRRSRSPLFLLGLISRVIVSMANICVAAQNSHPMCTAGHGALGLFEALYLLAEGIESGIVNTPKFPLQIAVG